MSSSEEPWDPLSQRCQLLPALRPPTSFLLLAVGQSAVCLELFELSPGLSTVGKKKYETQFLPSGNGWSS